MRQFRHYWVVGVFLPTAMIMILLIPGLVSARMRTDGAGGCGQFDADLSQAEPGDLVAPMRGGVNTNGVVISQTLVIQGGWIPNSGDCDSNGTDTFADAAAATSAGFSYDPNQRSEMFGNFDDPVLPVNLNNGQTLVLQNLEVSGQNANLSGIAVSGVISDGARLRLEYVRFAGNEHGNNALGGAVYLDVRGGSQVVIADSSFEGNNAFAGGAMQINLYDGSTLLIENSSFSNNEALTGDGGALKVVMYDGTVVIRNSSFSNNNATNGSGGAIRLERAPEADGPTSAVLIDPFYDSNSAGQDDADLSLSGVTLITPRLYFPLLVNGAAAQYQVQISGISMQEAQYKVEFTTNGYTPALPGRHVHFFFNTVPPTQAGSPGSGPWKIYGSSAPFTEYGIADRPKGATQICALVANSDHTVIPASGNCVNLP